EHASVLRCACLSSSSALLLFLFNDPPPSEIYPLSLHDALPIFGPRSADRLLAARAIPRPGGSIEKGQTRRICRLRLPVHVPARRSEEHTSELQSLTNLVCRLLLEKKKAHHPHYLSDHIHASRTC